MSKEWILNSVMNRFQLNFKRNVGVVAEEIRKCSPKKIEDWEEYYFKDIRRVGISNILAKNCISKSQRSFSQKVLAKGV